MKNVNKKMSEIGNYVLIYFDLSFILIFPTNFVFFINKLKIFLILHIYMILLYLCHTSTISCTIWLKGIYFTLVQLLEIQRLRSLLRQHLTPIGVAGHCL